MTRNPDPLRPEIQAAEAEARRFLSRIHALRQAVKNSPPDLHFGGLNSERDRPLEHAAMKRASLDLTRALAKVRMPL